MAINGWEHHELEKEMIASNMAQLLDLFKRENEKYIEMCVKYVDVLGELTQEARTKIEEQCRLLEERKIKVSLEIAERMTDTSCMQREVIPKKTRLSKTI